MRTMDDGDVVGFAGERVVQAIIRYGPRLVARPIDEVVLVDEDHYAEDRAFARSRKALAARPLFTNAIAGPQTVTPRGVRT